MKIFVGIICFLISHSAKGQLDTLVYLKNYEIQKNNYIGQPFSVLLNDMVQIQPNTIWSFGPTYNKYIKTYSHIYYCSMEESFYNKRITMIIHWQNPLPNSEVNYYSNRNNFYFTPEERTYYGNKIIKDIKVYRAQ